VRAFLQIDKSISGASVERDPTVLVCGHAGASPLE
jgi:hypothetical protein